MIWSLDEFASANLVAAGEHPNVRQWLFLPGLLGIRLAGSWTLTDSAGLEGSWSSRQVQWEGIVGEHMVGETYEVLRNLHCDFQVQIKQIH